MENQKSGVVTKQMIYWHNAQTPEQQLLAVENDDGYFNCLIPYEEEDSRYVKTMNHSISKHNFFDFVARGYWVIDSVVEL